MSDCCLMPNEQFFSYNVYNGDDKLNFNAMRMMMIFTRLKTRSNMKINSEKFNLIPTCTRKRSISIPYHDQNGKRRNYNQRCTKHCTEYLGYISFIFIFLKIYQHESDPYS